MLIPNPVYFFKKKKIINKISINLINRPIIFIIISIVKIIVKKRFKFCIICTELVEENKLSKDKTIVFATTQKIIKLSIVLLSVISQIFLLKNLILFY